MTSVKKATNITLEKDFFYNPKCFKYIKFQNNITFKK